LQTITPELAAILKSKFGAGADGFRARVYIGAIPSEQPPTTHTITTGPLEGVRSAPVVPVVIPPGATMTVIRYDWTGMPSVGRPDLLYRISCSWTRSGDAAVLNTYGDTSILAYGPSPVENGFDTGANPELAILPGSGIDSGEVIDGHSGGQTIYLSAYSNPYFESSGPWSISVTYSLSSDPLPPDNRVPGVKRVSIDKSLQTDADALEVELDNSDGSLNLSNPDTVALPGRRIRIFQWYGDPANEVQVFDGFIDKVQEHG